ncbi:MAG: VWA domain-containing protein [Mariniblastus sp.]|nr:VWA domain-containing protein [Mariniblastus sp.]
MNISCSHCGGRFSITADQLGRQGQCPHCRATVMLPRKNQGQVREYRSLPRPNRWVESALIGFGAVGINLVILIVFTMVPWAEFDGRPAPGGEAVWIGSLPRQSLTDDVERQFESFELEHSERERLAESMDSRPIITMSTGRFSESQGDQPLDSPSGGGQVPLELNFPAEPTLLETNPENFQDLLTRLNKVGLDIVITFDSTGSMQGEIDQVKDQIERIGGVLFRLVPKTRISICTYRDQGDAYVVKGLPLTDNLGEIVLFLRDVQASGGGDDPEAVDDGLQWSIEKNPFRPRARKVVLLFGDAPPRASRLLQCQKMVSDFRNAGGVVSTVTCRKPDRMDEFVSIAQIGRGEAFLTQDEQQLMSQLIVLVFGSQHRAKVLEAFDLLQPRLGR